MTEGPRLCGNSWVFQQDNAAVHNARLTKDFFRENNITLLDHPACSPDLNPIENIWGWMAREVYKNDELDRRVKAKQPPSATHLWELLQQSWEELSEEYLISIVESLEYILVSELKIWVF
uniref:Tc1-like transposase DDE domain-containing protein n=1 Tax=Amphiprion percula TaxID=161767 RepID=A0A3P8U0I5_AMPPE